MKLQPIAISLEIEPSFIAVGPYHLAAGMNNRVWFYDLTKSQPGADDAPLKLKDRQYLGAVTSVRLNAEYASVLFEGKLLLHMVSEHFYLLIDGTSYLEHHNTIFINYFRTLQ